MTEERKETGLALDFSVKQNIVITNQMCIRDRSVSTVSRAVNQKEYVKEETRERVLRALEEYNYVPNEVARSLKMKSTKTIGIVVPDICETLFGMIIKGICLLYTSRLRRLHRYPARFQMHPGSLSASCPRR